MVEFQQQINVGQFHQNGVLHIRNILGPSEIYQLAKAIDQLSSAVGQTLTGYDLQYLGDLAYQEKSAGKLGQANQYDLDIMAGHLQLSGAPRLEDKIGVTKPAGKYLIDTGCWQRNKFIQQLALKSVLPALAAQLLESRSIRFYDDQLFVKTPGSSQRTAYHQDYAFFNLEGMKGCVFWIPVDPVNQENGGLSYVRGSHLWDEEFRSNMFISRAPMPGSKGKNIPAIENEPEKYDLIQFDVKPGDVVIHHFRTIHGAGGNLTTDKKRRAMSFRYVGDDMRYKNKPGATFQPYQDYGFSDGDELSSKNFPTCWPASF